MKWITLCLRNKLIVFVLAIASSVAGLIALYNQPITPLPKISQNSIFMYISYPGANAQVVQQQITNEVVNRLQSIENVKYISTYSQAGSSNIFIMFHPITPVEQMQAQLHIIQAINSAHLPPSVPQPYILNNSGQSDLIQFVVSSKELSVFDLDNFMLSTLYSKFNSLPGVLTQSDYFSPVVKIKLNPDLLTQYQLDPSDVADTINKNYSSAPLGSLYIKDQQYLLNTDGDFSSMNAISNLLIGYKKATHNDNLVEALHNTDLGMPIYLKDIATLSFEPQDSSSQPYVNFNGENAAQIVLYTRDLANPFAVSKTAMDYIASIKDYLPADIKITPVFDMANIMLSSIKEVASTIWFSSALVFFVALIFLGRLKVTLIPIVAIPISLLGALAILSLTGFSINLLTLLAMVIAVGLVVDDAIVVAENITRYIENGYSRYDAVIKGTSDIALTIVGITLTLLAVYAPLMFATGQVAVLLKPFALTLAAAVLISGIVALTLTPIMSLMVMKDYHPNRYQLWFDNVLQTIVMHYQHLLRSVLSKPKTALTVIIILIAVGLNYAAKLPKMVFPPDPNGSVQIVIQGMPGDSIDSLKQKIELFSQFYENNPKIFYYLVSTYKDDQTGALSIAAKIKYKDQYIKELPKIVDNINSYIKTNAIKNTYATMQQFLTWFSDDYDISFYVYGSGDQTVVDEKAQQITDALQKLPAFSIVNNSITLPQKQLAFDIDTVKAAELGISRAQIMQLLSTLYGGMQMSNYFSIAGLSVPMLVQIDNNDLTDPQSFQKLTIYSATKNEYYALADFVTIKMVAKPLVITTFNNQPATEIQANLNKGYDVASGIAAVNQLMQSQNYGLQYQYVTNALSYVDSNNETIMIVLLGVLSIYLLLTVLFKSLFDPFIVMLTVPFSVIGGALSLYFIHGSLNVFSMLGLITLIGLITKHGILIVQFANTEIKRGLTAIDAVLLATKHRFRPIIMTTLAMAFGALPLMWSDKVMYVSRQNLAIVIIGGLAIGTLFSLFIVPLVYVLFKSKYKKLNISQ